MLAAVAFLECDSNAVEDCAAEYEPEACANASAQVRQ